MTLEDTVGDIIRKARQSANVSLEEAAKAARLSPDGLSALEDTGKTNQTPDYRAVAQLVHLDGPKLERIAGGWLPPSIDLGTWRELRQITTQGSGMSVNCYLIWDEVTREAALFDTGFDAQPIFALLDQEQLQLKHLFVTHTHADHVAALGPIREKYPKVKLHSNSKSAPPDQRNRANDFIHLGSLRITNRDTPGHAEDGVTYVIGTWPDDAPNVAVVGDAIFAGSIGGAKQLADLAKQKIRDQIFSLPPATLIGPGHGPVTTVEQEKANNPFFT
jgi:glyoxylase-like metal-dependent hydrolase (beta-lactamase superfamily II)